MCPTSWENVSLEVCDQLRLEPTCSATEASKSLWIQYTATTYELLHDKTNKTNCVPSEDSDQPGNLPSLIRVFAVPMKKHWALNYLLSAQWSLWSDGWMPRLVWVFAGHTSFCEFCWVAAHIILPKQQITKTPIKLCGCAGWFASLLFAYGIRQVDLPSLQLVLCRVAAVKRLPVHQP